VETRPEKEIDYDRLLDRIIDRFQPVRRLWPVNARLAVWLTLELATIAIVVLGRPRHDLAFKLDNFQYVLEIGLFMALGVAAAGLALRTAIPGREVTMRELIWVGMGALLAFLLLLREPVSTSVPLGQFIREGARCCSFVALLAAGPWLALFVAVRRGAPVLTETTGGLIGGAAFFFGFVATRLGCPIDDSLHLLLWHALPIAAGVALSMLAGMAWLGPNTSVRRAS
jgi:hypothetical protein